MHKIDLTNFKDIYPFKSNIFKINYNNQILDYHYIDEGNGEPIIMLHGNPTWSFYYRNLISALSKNNFRAIAVDHIGCGLSDKPQNYDYTLNTHIKNFENFVTSNNLFNITLVMHDWGGAIGMGYATKYPNNIKRLIILNTAAFCSKDIPFRINVCKLPIFGDIFIRLFNGFAKAALHMAINKKDRLNDKIKTGYLAPYDSYKNRIALLRFVQDIPMSKSHKSFKTLLEIENNLSKLKNKPTLIIWGSKDFCFTTKFMNRWKDFLKNIDIRNINDAGHYVLEDAHERIIPWILNFLNKTK